MVRMKVNELLPHANVCTEATPKLKVKINFEIYTDLCSSYKDYKDYKDYKEYMYVHM